MMASVALSAPAVPPETGASTYSMPAAARISAAPLAAAMPMVEVSITVLTLRAEAPASSRATAWLMLPSGSDRMTVSASAATSALLPTIFAPVGARSVLTASAITREWPPATRCRLMRWPMLPMPIQPMVSVMSRLLLLVRGHPLRRW